MRWLKWLGIISDDQDSPIQFREPECWRVVGTTDAAAFYDALVHLTSPAAVLYVESTTEKHIPAYLRSRRIPDHKPVKKGAIFSTSDRYHIPATPENLRDLAALIRKERIVFPAIHTHLYRGQQVLLEWYEMHSRLTRCSSHPRFRRRW